MIYKNLHLGISSLVIFSVALAYGTNAYNILDYIFYSAIKNNNIENGLKAIMGLYLSFVGYWILGIIKHSHWKNATITNVLFMGGLGFGRILGVFINGIPSLPLVAGLCTEIVLFYWGIKNLKKYKE